MEDRLGTMGYTVERCLWGDSRARHTSLIACTDEHPLVMIEIDIGDHDKGIHKSMTLKITELDEVPDKISQIILIGEIESSTALENLIHSAQTYVHEHPHYNVLLNNCRTFVEYIIDQIPEFRNSLPRKNGSILEYYHSVAKHEHPGAIVKSKELLKTVHNLHRCSRRYTCANRLVLAVQLPKLDNDNNTQITQL
jgi:hypothetical protein